MSNFDFERARFNMVEQQIRTWEVLDERVLDVIRTTPREAYVPEQHRSLAYADLQIPLPNGQFMLEPKVAARMLQTVDAKPSEQALLIGTGSGYVTACLARLCAHVTGVEYFQDLKACTERNLSAQGIRNVTLEVGDAANGWDDGRRYDVILVTASMPELHQGFHKSLTVGGRLLVVVGTGDMMETLLITRVGEDQWATESVFDTYVQPLINARQTKVFAL